MSEPTYPTPTRGDWSQVYTGLDWVARWMADRGYTDAEIGYVVGDDAAPSVAVAPAFEPVEVPVQVVPAAVVVATEQTTWTVPLAVVDGDEETDEDASADHGEAEDTELPEAFTA